ncbi:MAG TPA: hypothetical protein VLF94_05850 [Chlamydiales bacterium]|nr:hypothetical protein [Chlamydiales bacterium]
MIAPINACNPIVDKQREVTFVKEADVAQYKGSDYANAIRVERGISLDEAFKIAKNDPEIDYFVYVKGYSMVLEIPPGVPFDAEKDPLELVTHTRFIYDDGRPSEGYCRIFKQGDVVFFKNEGKWLGTAPGLADVYSKQC